MNHCVWERAYKTMYEKRIDESGHTVFEPVHVDQGIQRTLCKSCKEEVEAYDKKVKSRLRMARDHFKFVDHCYVCVNCQPNEFDQKEDAPLCMEYQCPFCFMDPLTCIEKDACPQNDIIGKR